MAVKKTVRRGRGGGVHSGKKKQLFSTPSPGIRAFYFLLFSFIINIVFSGTQVPPGAQVKLRP